MINLPHYIINAAINSQSIDYLWSEDKQSQPFNLEIATPFVSKLASVSLRAKVTLIIGCYEWVIGRFYNVVDESFFLQLQEAAWCANVNKNYIRKDLFIEKNEYPGPIEGALWYAYSCIIPALYMAEGMTSTDLEDDEAEFLVDDYFFDENEWKNSLRYLISLVVHILPTEKTSQFINWLECVTTRLVDLYTMHQKGPFDNLWGHNDEREWLGNYVAREALDPNYHYQPEQAVALINRFFQLVDKSNPLLNSLVQLKEKIKDPFKIEDLE